MLTLWPFAKVKVTRSGTDLQRSMVLNISIEKFVSTAQCLSFGQVGWLDGWLAKQMYMILCKMYMLPV